ncbi:MAG: hypothetical protein DMG49_23835 [Acidobacteria bacterium]|nr:MAG: hypothetical protein DMG49_23835 [Acidobacteriota bacterium]
MPNLIERSSSVKGELQPAEVHPTPEEIERRAFQLYLERGGALGHDVEDWLQAERELVKTYGKTSRAARAGTT